LINLLSLANNPYGQFISTLWRGSEDRITLDSHVSGHYIDVNKAVINGIDLTVNRIREHFNVIAFFVADLSFVKDILQFRHSHFWAMGLFLFWCYAIN
jgi:Outer membrane cobalamin receptor protein